MKSNQEIQIVFTAKKKITVYFGSVNCPNCGKLRYLKSSSMEDEKIKCKNCKSDYTAKW